LNGNELTIHCGHTGGKSYRKGFIPYLIPLEGESVNVTDAEAIFTYCHFTEPRLVVQHIENATVRETQLKKYNNETVPPKDQKPSINVIMLDGVSRSQFIRALKRSTSYLEYIHQNSSTLGFDVFQFMRYSVVGQNSLHNLTPLLSGRILQDARANGSAPEFYHNSWLWKHAAANGYATLYADEQCPYRPHMTPWQTPRFDRGAGQVDSVHHRFGDVYCGDMKSQYGPEKRCVFGRQAHRYAFYYTESFFSHYNNTPKFSWTILYEGHEPTMSILPLLDKDLYRYLHKAIKDPSRITVLIADHGLHYGPYTHPPFPGRIEHMFPTLFMLVPNGFLELHPEVRDALRSLEQTLITAVDVYSILLHLIYWPNPPKGDVPEGIINLLKPGAIIENRSCGAAHIPSEFCYCEPQSWRPRVPRGRKNKPLNGTHGMETNEAENPSEPSEEERHLYEDL